MAIIMKIVVVLLGGVACRVFAETHGVFPAKILSGQKTVSESSDLYITCSTFGTKVPPGAQGFMYLCKDGQVVNKKRQRSNQNDVVFIVSVGLGDSGNYSCTYSASDLPLSTATIAGLSVLPIRVVANFHPADISVAGPPAVSQGDDVQLTCSVSEALQTPAGCPLVSSYLVKNGTVVQIKEFRVERMEVNFTIKDAALRDSGHYSCVVLPSKCTRADEEAAPRGKNIVFLEVKGNSYVQQIVIFGAIIVTLSVALGIWFLKKRQTAAINLESISQCLMFQQSGVLEEQEVEHNLDISSDDTSSLDEDNKLMFQQSGVLEEQEVEHNLDISSDDTFNLDEENKYDEIDASGYKDKFKYSKDLTNRTSDDTFNLDEENKYDEIDVSGYKDKCKYYKVSTNRTSVQRANPDVPAVTRSDNVNSVSPGVQSRENDIYIDPI